MGLAVFFATGDGEGFSIADACGVTIDGKLGIGREAGVSIGAGEAVDVALAAGVAVVSGVCIILGVTRRGERGPGLIGRTGSKY